MVVRLAVLRREPEWCSRRVLAVQYFLGLDGRHPDLWGSQIGVDRIPARRTEGEPEDIIVWERPPAGKGILQLTLAIRDVQAGLVGSVLGHQPQFRRWVGVGGGRGLDGAICTHNLGTNSTVEGNPLSIRRKKVCRSDMDKD